MWLYDFVLHCNNGNFIAESRLKLKAFKKAFCCIFFILVKWHKFYVSILIPFSFHKLIKRNFDKINL